MGSTSPGGYPRACAGGGWGPGHTHLGFWYRPICPRAPSQGRTSINKNKPAKSGERFVLFRANRGNLFIRVPFPAAHPNPDLFAHLANKRHVSREPRRRVPLRQIQARWEEVPRAAAEKIDNGAIANQMPYMSNDRRRFIRSPHLSTYLFAEIEDLFYSLCGYRPWGPSI